MFDGTEIASHNRGIPATAFVRNSIINIFALLLLQVGHMSSNGQPAPYYVSGARNVRFDTFPKINPVITQGAMRQ